MEKRYRVTFPDDARVLDRCFFESFDDEDRLQGKKPFCIEIRVELDAAGFEDAFNEANYRLDISPTAGDVIVECIETGETQHFKRGE